MPQFFVDMPFAPGSEIEIRGADARHITQALRLRPRDWIVLSDGDGRSFRATIERIATRSVTARIEEEIVHHPTAPAPFLALAIIKGDRFEWAIQKAVEVGCRRILPFTSRRCVPRTAEAIDRRKLERWRRIALEAAKQSGLPFRPEIDALEDFDRLIKKIPEFHRSILLYEGEQRRSLHAIVAAPSRFLAGSAGRVDLIIVGPEGGFADEEVTRATAAGAITVTLGSQILRVETAAMVALAIWQYELGNIPRA